MKAATIRFHNNADVLPLLPGETPLPKAPAILLDDGTNCIPQHYLSYHHTKASVEDIIAEIDCEPNFVLFVDEDKASIFIQVGIIGKDNYIPFDQQNAEKIVYGRRWRVEPQLPSSEIIQTAFLALSKAREHEIRELFKYTTQSKPASHIKRSNVTTPFSCHHDLPLIAMSNAANTSERRNTLSQSDIQACLSRIKYDHAAFSLINTIALANNEYLMVLNIHPSKTTSLPELLAHNTSINILIEDASEDAVLHAIMDAMLKLSSRFVEEAFTFKGFARFSRQHSIQKISALSAKTRGLEKSLIDVDFAHAFANANYATDSTRVPKMNAGKLGDKIKTQLQGFNIQSGILPENER